MSGRTHRRDRRRDIDRRGDEKDGEDTPGDDVEQLPDSSLQDLTQPADPTTFDQTFEDGDAALNISGRFDPVAGSKQVIPRIAYVLNFNLVWNPDRQRWEPQVKGRRRDDGDDGDREPAIILRRPGFIVLFVLAADSSVNALPGSVGTITADSPQTVDSSVSGVTGDTPTITADSPQNADSTVTT